jgi:sphingomyelin phosphodiesterase acid-like 3
MTIKLFARLLCLAVLLFLPYSLAMSAINTNAQMNFLVLTDIHFDPFIACYNSKQKPCPLITQLRAASPDQWSSILRNEDTTIPEYRHDTNYPLLSSSLAAAKKAVTVQQVQFVLVLGDFLGHEFRSYYKKYAQDKTYAGYQAFVKKTLVFLTRQIGLTFSDTDVYMIVGNNDSYKEDYYSDSHGLFFRDMAMLGSKLIKTKTNRSVMEHDFATDGYYAVDLPGHANLRLIMLNSVLFSTRAKGSHIDESAQQELNWLHTQLLKAKEKNQRVFIGMHIPEGIDVYALRRIRLFRLVDLWNDSFIERFQAELQQFAPQIIGVLAGHLHMDWFQVQQFNQINKIPFIEAPSISPIFGNNPKFKIYSYSPIIGDLSGLMTYYYPIHEAREYWIFTGN